MQLKELSKLSGISSASIKFYRREGLLNPGENRHPTLAAYSQEHLVRLDLISTLRKVVGLSIEQIRTLVKAIDDPAISFLDLLGMTQSLVLGYDFNETPEHPLTASTMERKNWPNTDSDARNAVNAQLASMEQLGIELQVEVVSGYADAVEHVARQDLRFITPDADRDSAVLAVAVGVHQYSKLLVRMLALAQTSESIRRYRS